MLPVLFFFFSVAQAQDPSSPLSDIVEEEAEEWWWEDIKSGIIGGGWGIRARADLIFDGGVRCARLDNLTDDRDLSLWGRTRKGAFFRYLDLRGVPSDDALLQWAREIEYGTLGGPTRPRTVLSEALADVRLDKLELIGSYDSVREVLDAPAFIARQDVARILDATCIE